MPRALENNTMRAFRMKPQAGQLINELKFAIQLSQAEESCSPNSLYEHPPFISYIYFHAVIL